MNPGMGGASARKNPNPRGDGSLIFTSIVRGLRILAATLREIFDESAYDRFLDRSRLQSSAEAYAIFQRENAQSKSRRPKCC